MEATTDGRSSRVVMTDVIDAQGSVWTEVVGRGVVCLRCGHGYAIVKHAPNGTVELPAPRVPVKPYVREEMPSAGPPIDWDRAPSGTLRGLEGASVLPGEP